jgi:hypothetical protein
VLLVYNPDIATQEGNVFVWDTSDIVTIEMDFAIGWSLYRTYQFQQGTFTCPGMPT